ncbi:hypothetical protein [Nocardia brasiliensis]|uniref:Uncharacterized protein n=1 Tax=Nocardia brasiliensis (strain ATCC 700358 / HUJEG-1) TaxID=1133849 RepID=K0F275_NOCB7|nr:hypothetical protein [Nocardia brasiliensis]AFU06268.1 hypothetical protein O3I_041615 [Nocardia brasiliensis ATCC 700358]OCF88558.1 hypothetical protein AW168_19690 [Nocardia brasiliensis]
MRRKILGRRKARKALATSRATPRPVVQIQRPPDSVRARAFGLGLAGSGAAHFTAPRAFDPLTARAFPRATRRWTYRNGFTELALGLAITFRQSRPIGSVGFIAYLAFLASRLAGARPVAPPTALAPQVQSRAPVAASA